MPVPWVSNPVARHVACPVRQNTPTVCTLLGAENAELNMEYYIQSLPTDGVLYETSPNYRMIGSDPKHLPDPIGVHQLPFHVTDPYNRVVYVPPANMWAPEGHWASFTYTTMAVIPGVPDPLGILPTPPPTPTTSEPGMAVMANPEGAIAGSAFDVSHDGDGWSISGNLADSDAQGGLRHQAFVWGGLSYYVYGVDEVQYVDFATGLDRTRWYFEASPRAFNKPELAGSYGGLIRFTVRSLYGNFSQLNAPLDWVSLECQSCNSGLGLRIVRFTDEHLTWDGRERRVELRLSPMDKWQSDPLNAALNFTWATECEIAAVLTNMSRLRILGDWTRGGEGIAIDDVAILAADSANQPAYPVQCQQGCVCVHNPTLVRPTCCR